jgi:hypothetical protein
MPFLNQSGEKRGGTQDDGRNGVVAACACVL